MNITLENIDAVNAVITAEIAPADYEEKVKKAIKDFRKKVNMPGFRRGMVPEGLVKKQYGPSILGEEVNKLLQEGLYNYIRENKVNMLGEPLPNDDNNDIELVEGDVLDIPVIHNTVRVIGEVMIPSVVSYEPRKNGSDYIAACGGLSPEAQRSKKYVIHMNGRSEKLKSGTKIMPGDQIVVPTKKKREGVADQTFGRIATMSTTIASLGTTAATMYMLIQRNKND